MKKYLRENTMVYHGVNGLVFKVVGREDQEYNADKLLNSSSTPEETKETIRRAKEALEIWGCST